MAITSENITQHELIGLHVKVVECSDPEKKGSSGEVLDETRDTLQIEDKKVVKENCRFLFQLPTGEEVEISGEEIQNRPEDRIN